MEYNSGILIANSDLQHHGILGQKWGRKNGPPYPLNSSISTGSKLKKKKDKPVTAKQYGRKKTKAQKVASAKDINKLSTEDLRKENDRMRLEQEYARLATNNKKSVFSKFNQQLGDQLAQKYAQQVAASIVTAISIKAGKKILDAIITSMLV